jgi:hypothetical protein
MRHSTLILALALAACTRSAPPAGNDGAAATAAADRKVAELQQQVEKLEERVDEMTPETAVLMAQVQIQHAKLYYAGHQENWALAGYTLHEMNEALQAVQTFNDQYENFPTPLSELVPSLVGPPLGQLDQAIRARDAARFAEAFDGLTAACNACHATLQRAFVHIQKPATADFPNQKFSP